MSDFPQRQIWRALGSAPMAIQSLSGGCIHQVARFCVGDTPYVVKWGARHPGVYQAEAAGLVALCACEGVNVPALIHAEESCLILEWIPPGRQPTDGGVRLGRMLAALHAKPHDQMGFADDNYLGETLQIGALTSGADHWPVWFWQYRLLPQWRWCQGKGLADRRLDAAMEKLATVLSVKLADATEPMRLLHGDLWGGNVMWAEGGRPYFIDPAVYYGHREADLAMTSLFGGFSSAFYAEYERQIPLAPGYREVREPIYQLYHILNHMNLFGSGYAAQARGLLERILDRDDRNPHERVQRRAPTAVGARA